MKGRFPVGSLSHLPCGIGELPEICLPELHHEESGVRRLSYSYVLTEAYLMVVQRIQLSCESISKLPWFRPRYSSQVVGIGDGPAPHLHAQPAETFSSCRQYSPIEGRFPSTGLFVKIRFKGSELANSARTSCDSTHTNRD